MTETREVLIKARAVIASEDNWCRYTFARDKYNGAVSPDSVNAVQFCALGAVHKVARFIKFQEAQDLLNAAANRVGGIMAVNDQLSHGRVLQTFDKAIEMASE